MPHTRHPTRAASRFGRQRWQTKDKTQAPLAATRESSARRPLPSVAPPRKKTELRAATHARTMVKLGTSRHVRLNAANDADAAGVKNELNRCKRCMRVRVCAVGIHRSSRSEPLGRSASRSGGVSPLLCRQPRRGGCRGGPSERTASLRSARVRHNPSLKRSANGMPPAPGLWHMVHHHSPGAGVMPSSPA